jgi:2-polyprenyl-3-methyl-5-hydroxy-6-metoxy-1,4-benzoquinol methylase
MTIQRLCWLERPASSGLKEPATEQASPHTTMENAKSHLQITKNCSCRLCGGKAISQFQLLLLNKHNVDFFRCSQCESLQTEPPFWLDEAYADQRRFFDTGAVIRNQTVLVYLWYIQQLFGLRHETTALDWGGGDGLFTRMMRDIGIDAYHSDKYATNNYAAGFDDVTGKRYDIITTFEVWEHLANPAEVVQEIFAHKPAIVFLTTGLYTGQGADWKYIWPATGRHVFFFSRKAMEFIAEKYGYSVLIAGGCTVFFNRPLSRFRRSLLRRILSGKNRRVFHAIFASRKCGSLADKDRSYMLATRA